MLKCRSYWWDQAMQICGSLGWFAPQWCGVLYTPIQTLIVWILSKIMCSIYTLYVLIMLSVCNNKFQSNIPNLLQFSLMCLTGAHIDHVLCTSVQWSDVWSEISRERMALLDATFCLWQDMWGTFNSMNSFHHFWNFPFKTLWLVW